MSKKKKVLIFILGIGVLAIVLAQSKMKSNIEMQTALVQSKIKVDEDIVNTQTGYYSDGNHVVLGYDGQDKLIKRKYYDSTERWESYCSYL